MQEHMRQLAASVFWARLVIQAEARTLSLTTEQTAAIEEAERTLTSILEQVRALESLFIEFPSTPLPQRVTFNPGETDAL